MSAMSSDAISPNATRHSTPPPRADCHALLTTACAALLILACTPEGSGGDPTDATPTDAIPTDATPTDATPTDGSPPDAGPCTPRWPGAAWNQPIADAPLDPASADIIAALRAAGGWGNGDRFQIDFSIEVLTVDEATPLRPFEPTGDHYHPDCDTDPVPVPEGGALEGEPGYRCEHDGDCHLIVWHRLTGTLYEMWRADIDGPTFRGGCLAIWDTARDYTEGRGDQCTSADAAGLPIAPLLFRADEVAAGRIDHAIRFILPNPRIAHRTYVRPATHATGAASADEATGIPYGARLRLRADYPLETLSPGARVVAEALQRYGMILADGGQIALTAQSDRFEPRKWDGLLGPHDLAALTVEDFDVVDSGPRLPWRGDCVRADPPAPAADVCPPGPRP